MKKPINFDRKPLVSAVQAALGSAILVCSGQVSAMNWELENGVVVDWDTTLTYDAQWRQEGRDDTVLAAGGNGLLALVSDDGSRNFDNGDMTQNRVSVSSDLDINYGDGGVFLRARGWYDEVYDDSSLAAAKPFQQDGIDDHKSELELLDAFFYHSFDFDGRVLDLRVGRQVISWGESLFLNGGVSTAQGPLDATKVNAPGVELKDVFLPIGQVFGSFDLTESLSIGGYYQYEWEETRIDAPGSYFSVLDAFGQGSVGDPLDTVPVIGVAVPVIEDRPDEGQWGVSLRYLAESLNNTEFGFYYLNYNDFTPVPQFDLMPAFLGDPSAVVANQEYFEDIDLYGFSFGTVLGATNVSGEISYRDGQPVQLAYAAGFRFERAQTVQAQVSLIHIFGASPLADNLTLMGEVGYNRVLDIDGVNGDVKAALDNDRSAAGATLTLQADYFGVASGLDLVVTGTYRNDFDGVSSVPNTFTKGVEQFSLKADFTYLNKHKLGLSYVKFLTDPDDIINDTGELEIGHLNADRDYFAAYYKYSF